MQARQLPPVRGWQWLAAGLALWRRNPGLISAAAMASLLLSAFLGAIPMLGTPLACLAGPLVSLTVIRICHHVATGQPLRPERLRVDRPQLIGLLILGAFLFVALFLGDLLNRLIAGDALAQMVAAANASGEPPKAMPTSVLWGMVVYMLVIALAGSMMWFAPMLTALRKVSPAKALFFTAVACWRNKWPFLVFGLSLMMLMMPLSILVSMGSVWQSVSIMLMVGLVWPVVNAVNYLSMIDIFGDLFRPDDEA